MKISFDELKNLEPSLTLLSPDSWQDSFVTISTVKKLKPQSLIFIKDKKFLKLFLEATANQGMPSECAVVVNKDLRTQAQESLSPEVLRKQKCCLCVIDNAQLAMARMSKLFFDQLNSVCNDMVDGRQMGTAEVHPSAWIAQGVFLGSQVKIGKDVQIFPGVTILSQTEIGEGSVLFPNVVIYRFVKIGRGCRIHASSVIGADGFGYYFHQGVHHKIWHLGSVVVEDNVEIGACTTIDRGTFADTMIQSGAIIDNQVQIGHNCQLGKGVVVCGQTGFAGSCEFGDYSVAAGRAAFAPDIKVGKQCQIAGLAGVTGNLPDGSIVAGHPARPVREWLRAEAKIRSLIKREEKD
ncbi:MAG: UDP-3-O-(3-hydroxymyristoyl)glucosamine N-acyltransferase [Bdellovibrio sp.]|nr:UDP-3-O-(3-hydroxymyristoyl)glucosamine N-acyltransferase [Bdellovibrio sp.]